MLYKRFLTKQEEIEEGFFGTIVATAKLSKAIVKITEKYKKELSSPTDKDSLIKSFKEMVDKCYKEIDKSKLSDDFKKTFKKSFIEGMKETAQSLKIPSEIIKEVIK